MYVGGLRRVVILFERVGRAGEVHDVRVRGFAEDRPAVLLEAIVDPAAKLAGLGDGLGVGTGLRVIWGGAKLREQAVRTRRATFPRAHAWAEVVPRGSLREQHQPGQRTFPRELSRSGFDMAEDPDDVSRRRCDPTDKRRSIHFGGDKLS